MTCEQCGGSEGELRAYWVTTPHGNRVKRVLHPVECLGRYTERYTKWFNEKVNSERYAAKVKV